MAAFAGRIGRNLGHDPAVDAHRLPENLPIGSPDSLERSALEAPVDDQHDIDPVDAFLMRAELDDPRLIAQCMRRDRAMTAAAVGQQQQAGFLAAEKLKCREWQAARATGPR
jgi:hypothetical protein